MQPTRKMTLVQSINRPGLKDNAVVKALPVKPGNLSSSPRTVMVKGENKLLQVVSTST